LLTEENIISFATAFRHALELADTRNLSIGFTHFPAGSCGDATIMLMYFVAEHGGFSLTYIGGSRSEPNQWSHAWCQIDGYYVDITGDQFAEEDRRSIVVAVPGEDDWFAHWEIHDEIPMVSLGFGSFASNSMLGYQSVAEAARALLRGADCPTLPKERSTPT
jgi:hypothetical protein